MIIRSILLGGAVTLALAGAGFAQQASDKSSTDQAQSDQTTQITNKHEATTKTVHHYRHHARHHMRTASEFRPSTPAERQATHDLNAQQLQMAQSGAAGPQYAQGPAPEAQTGAPPAGENNGMTPTSRIPNGTPYQTLTPAGGRQDTPAMDQAHPK